MRGSRSSQPPPLEQHLCRIQEGEHLTSPQLTLETWDDPQGAEGGHFNEEKISNSNTQNGVPTCWQCKKAVKPQQIERHFSPYPTRMEVFHIGN